MLEKPFRLKITSHLLQIRASGEIKRDESKFHLKSNVQVSNENEELTVEVDAYADYKLEGDIEDPR